MKYRLGYSPYQRYHRALQFANLDILMPTTAVVAVRPNYLADNEIEMKEQQ